MSDSLYSSNGRISGDAGEFESNICFDLAQDPIVTLCGHLFCWPCLYKRLTFHSGSKGCPVCNAIVEQDKLVPLYGRGERIQRILELTQCKVLIFLDVPWDRDPKQPLRMPEAHHARFARQDFGFDGGLSGGFAPWHHLDELSQMRNAYIIDGFIREQSCFDVIRIRYLEQYAISPRRF